MICINSSLKSASVSFLQPPSYPLDSRHVMRKQNQFFQSMLKGRYIYPLSSFSTNFRNLSLSFSLPFALTSSIFVFYSFSLKLSQEYRPKHLKINVTCIPFLSAKRTVYLNLKHSYFPGMSRHILLMYLQLTR